MWDIISRDYNTHLSGKDCVKGVVPHIRPGSIIAFHDSEKSFRNMSYALPRILDHIRNLGLVAKAIEL